MCFTQYGNYQILITLLKGKLSVALQKIDYSTLKESTVERPGTPVTPCSSRYGAPSNKTFRLLSNDDCCSLTTCYGTTLLFITYVFIFILINCV